MDSHANGTSTLCYLIPLDNWKFLLVAVVHALVNGYKYLHPTFELLNCFRDVFIYMGSELWNDVFYYTPRGSETLALMK